MKRERAHIDWLAVGLRDKSDAQYDVAGNFNERSQGTSGRE